MMGSDEKLEGVVASEKTNAYRADIDGLRAVAVLLVVAFHLQIAYVNGGFIGVDVFFVISGYLITSILLRDLNAGRFSLKGFYERRVRRIAPALLVVLMCAAIGSWYYLLPFEFVDFGKSLFAGLFSVSNIYFWSQTGYFSAPSATKPLLHIWSLAVEEQFYLAFPLFLAAIYRYARTHLARVLAVTAVVSFVFSLWATRQYPDFAFYWPFSRAWELLLGAMLNLFDFRVVQSRVVREVTAFVGLAMIFAAGLFYSPYTSFPGAAALLPCVGAALLIAAGTAGRTLVGTGLSLRPVVFVGLISYSLYLWHWPVIVFQQLGFVLFAGASEHLIKVVNLVLALLLATLSWRFVERPFRKRLPGESANHIFYVAGTAAAVVALVGAVILIGKGVPHRFPPQAVAAAAFLDNPKGEDRWHYREGKCFITPDYRFRNYEASYCLQPGGTRPTMLIFGDSHASQLYFGFSQTTPTVNFQQAAATGCKPTLEQGRDKRPDCVELVDFILHTYLPEHLPQTVILAARWAPEDMGRLGETIAYLKKLGIKVWVMGPNIEYDMPLPRLLAISIKQGDPGLVSRHRESSSRELDDSMAKLAMDTWHVRYTSVLHLFCAGNECQLYALDGTPLLGDTDHFTAAGSLTLATKLHANGQLP